MWNGRSWSVATVTTNGGVLLGVSCLTTDRCVAVDVTGTAITTQRATAVATRPWRSNRVGSPRAASLNHAVGEAGRAGKPGPRGLSDR